MKDRSPLLATHTAPVSDSHEDGERTKRVVPPPSRKISEAFRAALKDYSQQQSFDEDLSGPHDDLVQMHTVQDCATTSNDSPLVHHPAVPSHIVIPREERVSWRNIEMSICVYARQDHPQEEMEITLDRGVFYGTTIKIFYDEHWFVVEIQASDKIARFIHSQIDDLIQRIFSCSVDYVRVDLNHSRKNEPIFDRWVGTHGVVCYESHQELLGKHNGCIAGKTPSDQENRS